MMTNSDTPLSLCREGDTVVIRHVDGGGAFKNRLTEMGFMRDVQLTIVKYAPLRDPLEVELKGFYVSLRVEEAANIYVQHAVQSV